MDRIIHGPREKHWNDLEIIWPKQKDAELTQSQKKIKKREKKNSLPLHFPLALSYNSPSIKLRESYGLEISQTHDSENLAAQDDFFLDN